MANSAAPGGEDEGAGQVSALDRDAAELHTALNDLVRVYQFRDRKRICFHDVSVTQCYALSAVVREGDPTINELAEELYLDKSTTSRVIDSLVRKGYARRHRAVDDGRVVRVKPTEKGIDLFVTIESHLIEQEKRLIADFDPEVRQATARLIARLARAARERFSREDGTCCGTDDLRRPNDGDW
ncbi:MAG: winged helix-turn-helix transcriptional regulator [Candidatus Latescibacterota bacterium]|nr:MAG: winged helix-turn-helix transcriptional regulator [Candidatus Latescibacterota bacterium]